MEENLITGAIFATLKGIPTGNAELTLDKIQVIRPATDVMDGTLVSANPSSVAKVEEQEKTLQVGFK